MKYFIDTEFLEGTQKEKFPISLFRKNTPPTIDLISIGIVAEDGREYYAISKDFNLKEAWNRFDLEEQSGDMRNVFPEGRKIYWLRENVLKPIYHKWYSKDVNYHELDHFTYYNFKKLLTKYGKTNKQIAEEVKKFCIQYTKEKPFLITKEYGELSEIKKDYPEFYAYYADYDWVVFCWLFGKMIDLPKGFPMYCKDLKQMMDDKAMSFLNDDLYRLDIKHANFEAVKSNNYSDYISAMKNHSKYPKQENEHSAIDDARWNKKLYDFLGLL